jgi:hypothetical protein
MRTQRSPRRALHLRITFRPTFILRASRVDFEDKTFIWRLKWRFGFGTRLNTVNDEYHCFCDEKGEVNLVLQNITALFEMSTAVNEMYIR